ncbi:MAG: methionine--tRNA ligase subunit beta [Thermoprotei archaeon]|nr:MAG: methionine--tRNA ligase subunit beta [Thermoprotei archaeon]
MSGVVDLSYFERLDIRVGRVVSASRMPGSAKLLRLEVDLGGEVRQLVAGIAAEYSPEELEGKLVVVLANLKPKVIRGVLSQGMLLAADVDGRPVLLTTDRPVPPGSKVR